MAANAVYSDAMLKNMTDIQTDLDELKLNIDNMFLIINGIIVSLMQVGFACLEAGCVQPKNVTNILMKNVLDLCVTYPIVSHWVWSPDGWLLKIGYSDFSGAGAVHLLAGTCSFVAALFIGPRIGRFSAIAPNEYNGHSMPLVATGTLLLISGFLSFNGASLGHISQPGDGVTVARSVTNTIFGGCGAAVVILLFAKAGLVGESRWPFAMTINATLIGMVSVCGAVNEYTQLSCIIIGMIGCLVYLVLQWVVPSLKVDDPLETTAVHFGGGLWGVIATPLFGNGGFWNNTKAMPQMKSNLIGAGAIILWSVINSVVLFGFLRVFDLLRVSKDQEVVGLDISLHKESAYPVTNISVENGHKNHKLTVIRHGYDNMAMQQTQ